MPTINTTREKYYLKFRGEQAPSWFQHEPPPSQPAQPSFPSTLTVPQQTEVKNWRSLRGTAKATAYAALTATAKTKADEFIAWDASRKAWEAQNQAARREQWAWFAADSAISNYDTVPMSGTTTGDGDPGDMVFPQTKQEL